MGLKRLKKINDAQNSLSFIHETPEEILAKRESKEIILAFSGPVGSGTKNVIEIAIKLLKSFGYNVHHVKISNFITNLFNDKKVDLTEKDLEKDKSRYERLQTIGNKIREDHGFQFLSEIAISKITLIREKEEPEEKDILDFSPRKNAFIIDQLKHPSEVQILRKIYGNIFYLVGVFCDYDKRKKT